MASLKEDPFKSTFSSPPGDHCQWYSEWAGAEQWPCKHASHYWHCVFIVPSPLIITIQKQLVKNSSF